MTSYGIFCGFLSSILTLDKSANFSMKELSHNFSHINYTYYTKDKFSSDE